MKHFIIVVIICALTGCSQDNFDNPTPQDLQGTWIEVKSKTDTLTFNSVDGLNLMTLTRGKEIINGHLLPKKGSGPYEYKLKEEFISLYWMLSSNNTFNDYRLVFKGNKLTVDNFYDSTLNTSLTFDKIN